LFNKRKLFEMIMNPNFNRCFSLVILLAFLTSIWNCTSETQPSSSAAPPAKVANGVKESDLATVTLSPEAEQRLGIATARVEKRRVARTLKLSGEIVAIPGRRIFVTAPVAGVMIAPAGSLPQSGMRVRKGQTIFRILPLPAERDLLGTPEEVTLKKMQLAVAAAKAKRAEQLLLDKAGSVKAQEEAQAELAAADASFKAAEARLHLTNSAAADSATLAMATMTLASPFDGVIQQINVAPRQTVAAGAELFEVISQNPVWVRVPVYVGDLATIDEQQPAQVEALGYTPGSSQHAAKPVQGLRLGDAHAASADLFFEMSNAGSQFRIGEKVGVMLAQKNAEESLLVPFSAILYDIHGGTWVYVKTAPQVYSRRRVELHHVVDGLAVLTRGPAAETEVVITGAAEIFGTEFGGGK
jgi:RND family efflux transporter MFP subunit